MLIQKEINIVFSYFVFKYNFFQQILTTENFRTIFICYDGYSVNNLATDILVHLSKMQINWIVINLENDYVDNFNNLESDFFIIYILENISLLYKTKQIFQDPRTKRLIILNEIPQNHMILNWLKDTNKNVFNIAIMFNEIETRVYKFNASVGQNGLVEIPLKPVNLLKSIYSVQTPNDNQNVMNIFTINFLPKLMNFPPKYRKGITFHYLGRDGFILNFLSDQLKITFKYKTFHWDSEILFSNSSLCPVESSISYYGTIIPANYCPPDNFEYLNDTNVINTSVLNPVIAK